MSKAHTFKFTRTRTHTLRGELKKKKTLKKIYHISGFDCASCATQTELYLNQKDEIIKKVYHISGFDCGNCARGKFKYKGRNFLCQN